VSSLLESEPELANACTPEGLSALLLAAYYGQPGIASLLAGRRTNLDIFEASAAGAVERLHDLLHTQPGLSNATAPDGFQPLGLACFFGHYEAARLLVEVGAGINSPSHNSQKVMPLHSAAASRSLEIARLLLEVGADPNARQNNDVTPLQEAAANGQIEMAQLLLENGAIIDTPQAQGETPLSLARNAGHADMVDFLLKHGAE
jgi:ankyrin repeat protein